ncbi:hypothetical protein A2999_00735 [Candidatus Wolfebacteria bacterium RIFCSPLOWO2_01_FULL_38_11]|uniref:Uncharacterized protein n=2 Tax=Candidatus Wolfeibacteriota TaxID=1752735 RepID=A0A0G0G5G4_9BACT|nr:MAG: hypothetical protein US36_C0023G0002 [Candidatus Wolfebacteria bacterium GW2011_GWC1_37_10]OGM90867.1 MAG: hypothetical protein A2999_00735 [Candidatus Wolfebacteria bacterium RIFCSPLOWO2_01_FULL_38_11]
MEFNKQKFSLAASGTMGIIYLVCAIFSYFWPDLVIKVFGYLVHAVNLEKFVGGAQMTFTGFIIGLIQILVYSYIFSWIFVSLYNWLLKR